MRSACLVAFAAFLVACGDDTTNSVGARHWCGEGGQVLGDCTEVETVEDACWKLVECDIYPVDDFDGNADWGGCVDGLESMRAQQQATVIACIAAASCDQLAIRGDFEGPDCAEYP